jgi:hypothetical protein
MVPFKIGVIIQMVASVEVSNVKRRPSIVVGRPHTFGWLRRSECDRIVGGSYFEAWEQPEGGVVRIPRQEHNKPIETIIAARKPNSVLVISPKGATQAPNRKDLQV